MTTENYESYCLADRLFYDTPNQTPVRNPDFPIAAREAPEAWDAKPSDTWLYFAPKVRQLPSQGWKIHVSSCLDDADRTLAAVWDYCVPRGIAFKFLRNKATMVMLNSKTAFRGSSGKLATVYPADESQLELTLKELDVLLAGVRGPYILSDLRYRDGPLFVRYGGFAERYCLADNGERSLALEDGDGRLVPDVRGPIFAMPPWVTLPGFLAPHLAARAAVSTADLPYQIESALQFSNGGGVYYGHDRRTGDQVVLKEGRPYAGLDSAERDAVTRIAHERDILERLAGLDVVPAVHDYFTLGDHQFLVQEFIDGNPLQRLLVHKYPLTHPDCTEQDLVDYVGWALDMLRRVDRALAALHEHGVVFGDLHPENILVTPEKRLVLIDFEVATLAADKGRATLAHPAFQPPADRRGVDVDRYALACLHLGMFAPQLTAMSRLDADKVRQLADLIMESFPVPADVIEPAVATILGPRHDSGSSPLRALPMPGIGTWERVRGSIRGAIVASATPDRDDRLFPGDIAQFQPGGGINMAYGAAGVLFALAVTGAGAFPEYEAWLRERALRRTENVPPGFYDGRHGVAYVLAELGYQDDALAVLDMGTRARLDSVELGLFSGLAGIGLNLLHFADITGDATFARMAARVVDVVADRLGGPDDVPEISGGDHPHAGLMFGSSGPALLFLRAYERTGDTSLLDRAEIALRQDLRRCVRSADETLQVNQDWRTLPYLDEGSVGIAMVLARYLTYRPDDELDTALRELMAVTRSDYFVQAGLFTGRAGMIACAGMAADGPGPETVKLLRGLRWHALSYGDGLAYPGNQLLRLSMDLATGSAGVLLALGTALHDNAVFLPLFAPRAGATDLDADRHSSSQLIGERR
ncbi:MAG TPA: class III lanthionine synthetase LanKC [Pseudonocardiaceae bacterium]